MRMKQQIIKKIVELMKKNKININEVEAALKREIQFDLACEVNGKIVRFPFDIGFSEKVIGIFPNKRSNIFLYVEETKETHRKDANEFKIPTMIFWEEVFKVKDELNDALLSIGFQEIEGCYYARSSYLPATNWIVAFKEGLSHLATDFYDTDETAKIRYFGFLSKSSK